MAKTLERVVLEDPDILEQTKTHHKNRYDFARMYASETLSYLSFLDLCCGTGYGVRILCTNPGSRYLGIDISQKSIEYSHRYIERPYSEQHIVKDLVKRSSWWGLGKYNVITMFECIEHFRYKDGVSIVKRAYNHLENKGLFFLSTPRDINERYNMFHKSMWTFSMLKNKLGSIFNEVEIYGQDWDTGIINRENAIENDMYIAVCKK